MYFSAVTTTAALAALAGPAAAFWRMPCPSRLMDERIDALVAPGKVSAHTHTVVGGNGFGFSTSYNQQRASSCTSCPISQDLSAYWTPKLYFQFANGSFQAVPQAGDGTGSLGGTTVYYLQRAGPNNDPLVAFPAGFRMIAGDPFLRNYTNTFAQQAVSFNCLNYNAAAVPETNGLPTQNCADGVRAQVFFPSCWDGKNLDSADHKSHVSYPTGSYNGGACPAGFPIHLVSIFYETIYQTGIYGSMWSQAKNPAQPFVFAMGDPTGYGYHGDFVNGWDVSVLQNAVNNCNDQSGDMTLCPYFNFLPNSVSAGCHIPNYVQEDVLGKSTPLPKLPGCNGVQSGPGYATAQTCTDKPTIKLDTSYMTDVTSMKYKYVGCATDSAVRTLTGPTTSSNSMTVQTCISYCKGKGYSYAGLEYSSQCFCGKSVAASLAPVAGLFGACTMSCAGNSTQTCGGPNALSLYQSCSGTGCVNNIITPVGGVPALP